MFFKEKKVRFSALESFKLPNYKFMPANNEDGIFIIIII